MSISDLHPNTVAALLAYDPLPEPPVPVHRMFRSNGHRLTHADTEYKTWTSHTLRAIGTLLTHDLVQCIRAGMTFGTCSFGTEELRENPREMSVFHRRLLEVAARLRLREKIRARDENGLLELEDRLVAVERKMAALNADVVKNRAPAQLQGWSDEEIFWDGKPIRHPMYIPRDDLKRKRNKLQCC